MAVDETLRDDLARALPAAYSLSAALVGPSNAVDLCRRAFANALAGRRSSGENPEILLSRNVVHAWKERRPDRHRPKKMGTGESGAASLQSAFDALDPDDQSILILRDMMGRPISETAAILDVNVAAARTRLAHAREELRVARHRAEGRLI